MGHTNMKTVALLVVFALVATLSQPTAAFPKGRGGADCPSICPMNYDPVCANNGQTYGNACQMGVAACQTGTDITAVKHGRCESIQNRATRKKIKIDKRPKTFET